MVAPKASAKEIAVAMFVARYAAVRLIFLAFPRARFLLSDLRPSLATGSRSLVELAPLAEIGECHYLPRTRPSRRAVMTILARTPSLQEAVVLRVAGLADEATFAAVVVSPSLPRTTTHETSAVFFMTGARVWVPWTDERTLPQPICST